MNGGCYGRHTGSSTAGKLAELAVQRLTVNLCTNYALEAASTRRRRWGPLYAHDKEQIVCQIERDFNFGLRGCGVREQNAEALWVALSIFAAP
ncbi:hypothetical protein ACFOWX_03315 [Sphingorhabdus arenilitoris]|uniref:Transposase n=1 Tax=Sphingorhabdus arenilitoris TaxID=1490041 RepID=A0ABV8RFI0_9SPHN